MAKYTKRVGKENRNLDITLRIISLIMNESIPTSYAIVWKMGSSKEEIKPILVDSKHQHVIINTSFKRVQTIQKEEKKNKYFKKLCQFKLKRLSKNEESIQVGEIEVDITPMIGKPEAQYRLEFSSEIPYLSAFLEVSFNLQETLQKDDDGSDEDLKANESNEKPLKIFDVTKHEEYIKLLQEVENMKKLLAFKKQTNAKLEADVQLKDDQIFHLTGGQTIEDIKQQYSEQYGEQIQLFQEQHSKQNYQMQQDLNAQINHIKESNSEEIKHLQDILEEKIFEFTKVEEIYEKVKSESENYRSMKEPENKMLKKKFKNLVRQIDMLTKKVADLQVKVKENDEIEKQAEELDEYDSFDRYAF